MSGLIFSKHRAGAATFYLRQDNRLEVHVNGAVLAIVSEEDVDQHMLVGPQGIDKLARLIGFDSARSGVLQHRLRTELLGIGGAGSAGRRLVGPHGDQVASVHDILFPHRDAKTRGFQWRRSRRVLVRIVSKNCEPGQLAGQRHPFRRYRCPSEFTAARDAIKIGRFGHLEHRFAR